MPSSSIVCAPIWIPLNRAGRDLLSCRASRLMLFRKPGRLPRGRRPTFLRLNEDRVIIGVDIRPIQTTVALADVNGKFVSQESLPTPSDPQVAVAELIERIKPILRSCRNKKVEGIGVSL